jgi:hypothetical protein
MVNPPLVAGPHTYGYPQGSQNGWFDIRDYGALLSPNDIGLAVQAALTAANAYGGGTVFIPPRLDGVSALWGWTTLAQIDVGNSKSMSVVGVPGETIIFVGIAQANLLDVGNSNGIVQIDGITVVGDPTTNDNCNNVFNIRQARIGLLTRCQFWGLACVSTGYGVVRITADTTHVSDCLFVGCGYFGTVRQGGCLSIVGERDACVVRTCRFTGMDGTFHGAVNKGDPNTSIYLWCGGQGLDSAVTAYGEVSIENCYFEGTAAIAVDLTPEIGAIIDHARIRGCTFNAASNGAPPVATGSVAAGQGLTKHLVCDGCQWGNSAAGQYAIWFEGERLIVRECGAKTGGKQIKFTGPTQYALIDEEDPAGGFTFDLSVATPSVMKVTHDGCSARVPPCAVPINTVAPSITGNAGFIGTDLTLNPGTWVSDPPPFFAYQWQRQSLAGVWSDIGGATGLTYTQTKFDIGPFLRCNVTATNDTGAVTATSNTLNYLPTAEGGTLIEWWTDIAAGPVAADVGANGATFAAAGGARPTASDTSFNGVRGITADGIANILSAAIDLSGQTAVRIILGMTDANTTVSVLFEYTASIALNNGSFVALSNDVALGSVECGARGTGATFALGNTGAASEPLTTPVVMAWCPDTNNPNTGCAFIQHNGVAMGLSAVGSCPAGNFANSTLNLFARSGGVVPWAGVSTQDIVLLSGNGQDAALDRVNRFVAFKGAVAVW